MTFQCYKATRRNFNDALAGFPSSIKDRVEQLTYLLPCYSVIKGDQFLVCAFGCGSWTGRSQPQSVVLNTQRRSYHWSHWHIWHGIWLPPNDHPVSLCPRYIYRVKVYEKPIEGWQMWPGSRRRSVPKSPDSKWSWELRAPQLILVTACEHRLLFKGNQPRAYRGGRTAQSPPHLRVNRLQALSCLSEFVHISKHYLVLVIPWDKLPLD